MTSTTEPNDTPALRIGEVARRTGLSVATLRAWERRYGLLVPERTEGGQRLYRETDVDRILHVARLVHEGWSVGAAAARSTLRDRDAAPSPARAQVVPATTAGPSGRVTRPAVEAEPQVAVMPRPAEHASLSIFAFLAEVDPEATVAGYSAARDVLTAASAAEVRDALVGFVERLGGSVGPAATQSEHILPLDLSCGEGEPLLPRAAPFTLTRLRLETLLPGLVEVARHRLLALHGESHLG